MHVEFSKGHLIKINVKIFSIFYYVNWTLFEIGLYKKFILILIKKNFFFLGYAKMANQSVLSDGQRSDINFFVS